MATTLLQAGHAPAAEWRQRASRDVTVVIPAFRNVPYLPAAIESALHAPAATVIVADDGCGTEERRVFQAFRARHRTRLRVVAAHAQRGIATNLNEAIRRVDTPYFVRLDCDDVLYPGHIEAAYRLLAERPSVAAAAGREQRITGQDHLRFDSDALPPYEPDPNPCILFGLEAFRFAVVWRPNPCSSGTLFRTAAFRDVGAFNPNVPWGEDWEIWFRFAQGGWEVAYLDAPSALYRIHDGATTSLYQRERRLAHGYDWMYRRAARLCPYPDLRPIFQRAFVRVARMHAGAAWRQGLRLRAAAAVSCVRAVRALVTAARPL